VITFGLLARYEGRTDRALELLGLARRQPAWESNHDLIINALLREWALDPAVVEAGMAKGAKLDWDRTIEDLLRE
jgi:hypothetical protein